MYENFHLCQLCHAFLLTVFFGSRKCSPQKPWQIFRTWESCFGDCRSRTQQWEIAFCFKPTVVLWRGTTVRNLRKFNVLIFPLLCLFPAPFLLLFNYLKGTYKKICIGVKLSVHRNKCVFRLCLLIAPTHCSFIWITQKSWSGWDLCFGCNSTGEYLPCAHLMIFNHGWCFSTTDGCF